MNYTNASDDMTPAYNFIQTAFFFAHVLLITFFPHLYFPVVSFVKCIYPVCYASTSRERESKCSARMQQRCPTDSHGEWLSCIFVVLRRCSGFEDFFCAVPVNGVQLCRADMVCFEPLMSAVTCRYGDHPAAPVKYFDIKLRVTHACDLSLRSQLHGYAYCLPFVS